MTLEKAAWWTLRFIIVVHQVCRNLFNYTLSLLRVLWVTLSGRAKDRPGCAEGRQGTNGRISQSQLKPAKNVTIVLAERDGARIDVLEVAGLIYRCFQEELRYVFVYDPAGHIKSRDGELCDALGAACKEYKHNLKLGWQTPRKRNGSSGSAIFQTATNKAIVHVLDEADSVLPIVTAARSPHLSSKNGSNGRGNLLGASGSFFESPMHEDSLKEIIGSLFGEQCTMEPELVFVVGQVFTLAGCPPWHLKFSEIYHLGCLESLDWDKLTHVFQRYRNTVQRFGK